MSSIKRAFTLIELLVVIAIIAILAAILFPTFAEARRSGLATASLSNLKQINTSMVLYANDSDDHPVVTAVLGEPDSPFNLLSNGPYKPWSWLIRPYNKTAAIYQDPLTRAETFQSCSSGLPASADTAAKVYCPQYAYAFTVHSPMRSVPGGYRPFPVTSTRLESPSRTVMLVMKAHRNNGRRLDWVIPNSGIWYANLAQPPLCTSTGTYPGNTLLNSYCSTLMRWGVGGNSDAQVAGRTREEGSLTANNALRNRLRSIVTFADTSAKSITPDQLAAGTNWNWTRPAIAVTVNDRAQYMWDAD